MEIRWWVQLLYCVVLAVASGIIHSVYMRKIHRLQDVCDIQQKRIDSLREMLDARNQEIDRLQQENTKLKKIVDDRDYSPIMMALPPTVMEYSHKVIGAEVTLPLDVSDRFSAEDIEATLMKQLIPEIPKYWSIMTENDIMEYVKRYRATLHVVF
jgi:flagellar biosynthesis/type III secretory pathway chaperone